MKSEIKKSIKSLFNLGAAIINTGIDAFAAAGDVFITAGKGAVDTIKKNIIKNEDKKDETSKN